MSTYMILYLAFVERALAISDEKLSAFSVQLSVKPISKCSLRSKVNIASGYFAYVATSIIIYVCDELSVVW